MQLYTAVYLRAKRVAFQISLKKSKAQSKDPSQEANGYKSRHKSPFNANKRLEDRGLLYKAKNFPNQGTHSFSHLYTLWIHILAPDNQTFDLSIKGSLHRTTAGAFFHFFLCFAGKLVRWWELRPFELRRERAHWFLGIISIDSRLPIVNQPFRLLNFLKKSTFSLRFCINFYFLSPFYHIKLPIHT